VTLLFKSTSLIACGILLKTPAAGASALARPGGGLAGEGRRAGAADCSNSSAAAPAAPAAVAAPASAAAPADLLRRACCVEPAPSSVVVALSSITNMHVQNLGLGQPLAPT
jgi:hypothetical protein